MLFPVRAATTGNVISLGLMSTDELNKRLLHRHKTTFSEVKAAYLLSESKISAKDHIFAASVEKYLVLLLVKLNYAQLYNSTKSLKHAVVTKKLFPSCNRKTTYVQSKAASRSQQTLTCLYI